MERTKDTNWVNRHPKDVGVVLEANDGILTLWVNGITPYEGMAMPAPSLMPTHTRTKGATFEVLDVKTADELAEAKYQPRLISTDPLDRAWLMGRWLAQLMVEGYYPFPLPTLDEARWYQTFIPSPDLQRAAEARDFTSISEHRIAEMAHPEAKGVAK